MPVESLPNFIDEPDAGDRKTLKSGVEQRNSAVAISLGQLLRVPFGDYDRLPMRAEMS
jgi:hypothetical protein